MGRPSCQSSLLSDPKPNFFVEMWRKSNMRSAATSALTQKFYGLLIEAHFCLAVLPGNC